MFIDETDKTNKSKYFCLSGIIFKRSEYEDTIVSKVNELKNKHFGRTDIIFHYTDMKNNKREFEIFQDNNIRNKFYMDLVKLFKNCDCTILSTYFNKSNMKQLFGKCAISDYDVAFKHILENYTHYLRNKNGEGMIIMESRLLQQNSFLQNTFYNYINNGSELFSSEIIKRHLKCLGFIVKGENCAGLQLVDFVPSTLMRIIEDKPDKYLMQDTIKSKLYYNNTECLNIVGLKNILGQSDDKVSNDKKRT